MYPCIRDGASDLKTDRNSLNRVFVTTGIKSASTVSGVRPEPLALAGTGGIGSLYCSRWRAAPGNREYGLERGRPRRTSAAAPRLDVTWVPVRAVRRYSRRSARIGGRTAAIGPRTRTRFWTRVRNVPRLGSQTSVSERRTHRLITFAALLVRSWGWRASHPASRHGLGVNLLQAPDADGVADPRGYGVGGGARAAHGGDAGDAICHGAAADGLLIIESRGAGGGVDG